MGVGGGGWDEADAGVRPKHRLSSPANENGADQQWLTKSLRGGCTRSSFHGCRWA